MSIASRHGKLYLAADDDGTRHRRIEDLLTGDVFGAYRYLPASTGVLPLLGSAISADGSTLREWSRARGIDWDSLTELRFLFWPTLASREPDVLITICDPERVRLLVLVEAKLHSEQHEIAGRSQIGYYGALIFDDELVSELVEDDAPPFHRPVVYLTKATEPPMGALTRAREELVDFVSEERTDVFWTSWHRARETAATALETALETGAPAHVLALLSDLLEDLAERGFRAPRARRPWPMPPFDALRSDEVEAWLGARSRPARPGRSIEDLREARLGTVDDFLRGWRLR